MDGLTAESRSPSSRLLGRDDPPPAQVDGADRSGELVILCDHAGRRVPVGLDLGVEPAEMDRHIAWDIGAGALALELGRRLDATVVRQAYSRLVIDCNRDPARADAMPEVSDGTAIPANVGLDAEGRAARVAAVHLPYHAAIAALLDDRAAAGRSTRLLLVHSFTPVMAGLPRPWLYGVLHTGQPLALKLLATLREGGHGLIGDNQPYQMDGTDYTAIVHGADRGLDFVEIEVRQDLIADEAGQQAVASILAPAVSSALSAG